MSRNHVKIAAWATAFASIAIAVVHHVGRSLSAPEGWLACTAFAAPIAAVAFLALVGVYTEQPTLWLASGVALAVSSFLWTLAIPLIVPAVVMICTDSDRFRLGLPSVLAAGLAGIFGYMAIMETSVLSFGEGQVAPALIGTGQAYLVMLATAIIAASGAAWALLTKPAHL